MELTVFLIRKSDGKRFCLVECGCVDLDDWNSNHSCTETLGGRFYKAYIEIRADEEEDTDDEEEESSGDDATTSLRMLSVKVWFC